MRVAILAALVLPAFAVAQSTTVSGVTPAESGAVTACISSCSTQAATAAGCSSYADLPCVCTSAQFASVANACLSANCTTVDQTAAKGLDNTLCAAFSNSTSTNSSTTSGASSTATGASSTTSGVSSATTTTGGVLASLTSTAGAALSSLTSAAGSAAASTTSKSAAGLDAHVPGLKVLTAIVGALMATVVGPIVLFA